MFEDELTPQGYLSDAASGVWQRPGYAGIVYSDGDQIEASIEQAVEQCNDRSLFSDELRAHCLDWASTYHLSPARANLLVPFQERLDGANILEIGAGCGAITRFLGEAGARVLALEGTARRARICRKRTADLPTVQVLSERFSDFRTRQKFDIITLIGVLEYARLFTDADKPAEAMLAQVGELLAPGGTLLIAIENQLGLKYFAGALEDHVGQAMFGLEDRYGKKAVCTFGKAELTQVLNAAGFRHSHFLSPFPDYKLPSVIITEAGFRHPGFNAATLIGQTEAHDLQSPRLPLFSQYMSWPVVARNGLAGELANSFLVQASTTPLKPDNRNLGYHFSTQRSKDQCKYSVFEAQEDATISVVTRKLTPKPETGPGGNTGLQTTTAYIDHSTPMVADLYRVLTNNNGTLEEISAFFEKYRSTVLWLAGQPFETNAELPPHFVDAIPQNILIDGQGKAHLIDIEWKAEGTLLFDYLLYRAIVYSYNGCRLIRLEGRSGEMSLLAFISRLFQQLGLDGSETHLDQLAQREAAFQQRTQRGATDEFWARQKSQPVRKPDIYISHDSLQNALDSAAKTISDLLAHRDALEKYVDDQKQHIKALEQALEESQRALEDTRNSTSWKLTAPLRRLKGHS